MGIEPLDFSEAFDELQRRMVNGFASDDPTVE
jgi:hypothetical protein